MERDLKLHWQIVSLSDNWREKIIPRGLRINKFPSSPNNDAEFRKKWEGILNKCSLDLILLLIEEAKKERASLSERLQELRATLSHVTSEQKLPYEEKLKEDLDKLENTIKQMKIKKMKRDEEDYSRDEIYLWEKRPRRARTYHRHTSTSRERTVSFNLTSSDDEHNQPPPAHQTQHQTRSFLEEEWPRLPANPTRAKPAEERGRRGRGRPQRIPGPPRQGLRPRR